MPPRRAFFGILNSVHIDAIILKTVPYRENDLRVFCYTEQAGMLTGVARGALRPSSVQSMHLDQGNVVRFQLVAGKGMPIITGAQARDVFISVRYGMRRKMATLTLLEAVTSLVTGSERDDALWRMLIRQLHVLASCPDQDVLANLRKGQWELLVILGYAPRVTACGVCGSTINKNCSFSVEMGCALCSTCIGGGVYGVAMDNRDRLWLSGQNIVPPCVSVPVRAPTELLMEYIAGRPLRSLGLLFRALKA